ncbi:DUF4870 domain-containing protein [Roseiconus nitratireducens]|nr:DUF4870 domain-containing protein [Roseiconus nitratireducens]
MNLSDELARLEELRRSGSLSEIEFEQAKRRVIDEHQSPGATPFGGTSVPGQVYGLKEETWCALMHLSQLLVYSGLGIIVPIAMWLVSKDQSDASRRHGARMMNWLLSSLIYAAAGALLSMVLIGIPLLILVAILDFIFPIVAAVKANDGKLWSYPLAIRFFQED